MKFSAYSHVAFSGSRDGCPQLLLNKVAAKIRLDTTILVGCARGVDAQVRAIYPDACIFRAGQHGGKTYSQKLAMRSAAMVTAINMLHGCLVAFPMKPCPAMLNPCVEWQYGTWGTVALAAGLGVPTAVWLPQSVNAPNWGDRFSDKGHGWFLVVPF